MSTSRWKYLPFIIILAGLLAACGGEASTATPTATTQTESDLEGAGPAVTNTAVPVVTATVISTAAPAATATPTPLPEVTPTTAASPAPTVDAETATAVNYRVAFVEDNDTLNVRAGAGVSSSIVGELAPDAGGIVITGPGQVVSGSTWAPIQADSTAGWVNSRFLTTELLGFCQGQTAVELLGQLREAIEAQDSSRLAELVHPERGLRVRIDWWNPEILFRGGELNDLFASTSSYDWGRETGSGFDIEGSFAEVVLPVLAQDYLAPQTLTACNEILSGATAGMVVLPEGYDALNYYSVQRPAPEDGIEFDWGTWVVGIEQWQGRYYIGYLVHFDYEI